MVAVGLAQIVVAVATALIVYAIGDRLRSPGVGLGAATIATLHPYVVWHDVHLNREILDGLALALLVLCALAASSDGRSLWPPLRERSRGSRSSGTHASSCCRSWLAVYVAWRTPLWHALHGSRARDRAAAVVVTPWVVRNKVQVGCFALTTDARALWKANNLNTRECSTAAAGSTTCRSSRARRRGRSWPPI